MKIKNILYYIITMQYLPQYHDIKLYLQINDFREEYEKFSDEDKCEGFDELFMTIYDRIVMTWDSAYISVKRKKYNIDRITNHYMEPIVVTIKNKKFERLAKRHNLKDGDRFDMASDMSRKTGVTLPQISYWKRIGFVKNVI